MPLYGFLVVMEPESFRIFLQHVVVDVYKISNHSDMVLFLLGKMVWNASWILFRLNFFQNV